MLFQEIDWGCFVVMRYRRKLRVVIFFVGFDICGFDIKKVYVILYFKNQYYLNKKLIRCKVNVFVFKLVIVLIFVR